MAKNTQYHSADGLDEIRERRNAEIRAWGKKVLADADAALFDEKEPEVDDWDALDREEVRVVAASKAPKDYDVDFPAITENLATLLDDKGEEVLANAEPVEANGDVVGDPIAPETAKKVTASTKKTAPKV